MTTPDLTMFYPAPIADRNAWLRPGLMTSDDVEWYTPPEVRDAVVQALGGIVDLDPCADPGRTFPASDDLRLDYWSERERRWIPVRFELAYLLVDFFSENEDARREYEGHWRRNGDMYFLQSCMEAVRHGWKAAAQKVVNQRQRRGAA